MHSLKTLRSSNDDDDDDDDDDHDDDDDDDDDDVLPVVVAFPGKAQEFAAYIGMCICVFNLSIRI